MKKTKLATRFARWQIICKTEDIVLSLFAGHLSESLLAQIIVVILVLEYLLVRNRILFQF